MKIEPKIGKEHYKLMSEETWPDFEAMFEKHRGVSGGCWCTFHQCSSSQFQKMQKEERRDFHRQRVFGGTSTGVIYYEDDLPVAWCEFGKANLFEQINRNRAYGKLALPLKEKPDWRICCIFTDKDHRKEGLSKKVLSAALTLIEEMGGGKVEAFPLDIPGIDRPQYTGSVKMYLDEGFTMVSPIGKNHLLMEKYISKTSMASKTKE
ncbi:MAG: hypothetical protein WBI17_02150 [Clostridiaceae bacterium]